MSTTKQTLPRQGWREDVHLRLCEVIEEGPRGNTSTAAAPVAVFDFDNTCIINDIGELFSHYLIDEMLYRYDLDEFWDLIHPDDGRDELQGLTRALSDLATADRAAHPDFERYLADMGALYGRRLARAGKVDCYEWAVRLHVGMEPEQVRVLAAQAIERECRRPLHEEKRTSSCGRVTMISRGIRILREMHTLIQVLGARGFEVWIVSASNIWAVQVFAAFFGVPRERVLGNRLDLGDDGVLTGRTTLPVLYRQGKVDAIEKYIGRRPVLAFGDAETDLEMLMMARDLAVVIDKGSALLLEEADRHGWAVQPQQELHLVDDHRTPLFSGPA